MKWFINREELAKDKIELLNEIQNTNSNFFIEGTAGSGKTLMALHCAIDFAKKDKRVALVTLTNSLIRLFNDIIDNFLENEKCKNNLQCFTFYSMAGENEQDFYDMYDVFIFDEVQDINPTYIFKNVELIKRSQFIFWGDYSQIIYKTGTSKQSINARFDTEHRQLINKYRFSKGLSEFISQFPTFQFFPTTIEDVLLRKYNSKEEEINGTFYHAKQLQRDNESVLILFKSHSEIEKFISHSLNQFLVAYKIAENFDKDYSELNKLLEISNIPIHIYGNAINGNEKKLWLKPSITIMTIHSSKGLFADNVFIPFLKNSYNDFNARGNRHLFYVAITRACKKLFLSHHENDIENLLAIY